MKRTACSVLGIARLGLIGFVFSRGAEGDIGVSPCSDCSCVGFGVLGIGFVLHKKVGILR